MRPDLDEDEKVMATVTCCACDKPFELKYDEYGGEPLRIFSCWSAGVYKVTIKCPHCQHELEIY